MDPVSTCDSVISIIKKSGLNFQITETPFSVSINIRKTFIKRNAKQNVLDENSNTKPDFSGTETDRGNLDKSGHSRKQFDIFVDPTPTAKPSHSLFNS